MMFMVLCLRSNLAVFAVKIRREGLGEFAYSLPHSQLGLNISSVYESVLVWRSDPTDH